jgi:peroxiredoxin
MLAVCAGLSFVVGCTQPAPPAASQPNTTLSDLSHNPHAPLDLSQNRFAVLFFILADCPISNSYAPEINRIVADYTKQGVAVYVVHADRDMSDADLQQHAKEYAYACPVLVDRQHTLIDQLGIKIAPEVAIVDRTGSIPYRGRIDDRYLSFGQERLHPATPDLRNAINSLLRNEPISNPRTRAIGCAI